MASRQISELGKNFLVEPSGTELSPEERKLLERLQPAAIMLRKRNFLQDAGYEDWLKCYSELLTQIRQVLKHKNLIVSVDHEGGRVIRPPEPITRFPYAARWSSAVSEVAEAMAVELKSLGINVNFAPVADIHSNPQNPVINERAFGCTPETATAGAVKFAQALQANGIAPCAKHFPGHGDTKVDSHWELPVLNLTMAELKKRELVPFQALVEAGVPMIMTAHILFPKIDPEHKATVSRKLLHDLLRQEMGFKGVIIADALGMAATRSTLEQRETMVQAINASLDIFLVAGDNVGIQDAVNMTELLQVALEKGEVSEKTLLESHQRIDAFTSNLPQYPVTKLAAGVIKQHHKMAEQLAGLEAWETNFELSLPGFE